MKKWKQALALVLALVMALSLVALPSFAEGEDSTGTGTAQPEWPAEGSINLIKDAQPVEDEDGVYEITLTIQGKNYKTTSDVVLVIDNSNSMYTKQYDSYTDDYYYVEDSSCRMHATKLAAKAFAEKLLDGESETRIALSVYGTDSRWTTEFYNKDSKASLISKIESIAPETDSANGGTNQQAGIHAAQELLSSAASTGKQKNIVILSDGEATYSHPFIVPRNGSAPTTPAPDYTKKIGSGGDFEIGYYGGLFGSWHDQGNAGYYSGSSYKDKGSYTYNADGTFTFKSNVNTNNGVATIWEANQAKAAGTTIFSVALQAGTNGENTLKDCATDPTAGYFAIAQNDNVETKLTAAFETIAGSIAKAATNGSVVDPMSDYVGLDFAGDPTYTNDYAAYANKQYDVYLSQGTVTRSGNTLNWTVGDISEGQDAVMKYRVKLNDGLEKGKTYPTNQATTFHYTDYQDQETSRDFSIPEVAPNGGTILIHYYLVNANGQPINAGGTVVDSPDKAQVLSAQEYYTVNNSQALDYGTHQVSKKDIEGSNYYGYTLNGRDKNNPGVQSREATAEVAVATTNANREVWFAYTQSFYVAHVQMDENGQAKQVGATETYPVSAGFNLTDKVTSGYLYGGAFNSEACTEVYPFAEGETGLSFAPKAGETYYIWEVPNTYLKPMALSCWEHNTEGQLDVIGFYMVSAIDRSLYKEAGFYVNSSRTTANQMTYEAIDEARTTVANLPEGQSVAFKGITINLKQEGQSDSYTAASVVTGDKYGYMLCYGLDKDTYWPQAGASVSYYPYWVTLDGVEVTNSVTRTGTYQGTGAGKIKSTDESRTADCTVPAVAETQLLTMASYCADGTPISADVPTVEDVTVTVVDGAKTYELTVSAGTGVRNQVAYQAPAGKVFAGWFADQAYTIPADLDQVTEDTTIYAKYVSDSYLDLHYVRNGLFRLRGVTLISAVDNPANYQESGIIVDGVKVPVAYANRYRLFYTASGLFGAARNARLMITQQSLSGSGTLEVTPYWVTLDGTEVHGVTHTLHYNTRTIWE
jgi:hypothetical protein